MMTFITSLGQEFRSGSLTIEALIKLKLKRIAEQNSQLSAFITVNAESALQQARYLDVDLRSNGDRGDLHGIPIAIKDNIDTAGLLTTIGSQYFLDRIPTEDAAIVECLKAAGAVIIGKTNLSELAADISGRNATYGDMPNPWNLAHSAGGSSGGLASAIAANLCVAGIGTDMGGSIRVPASWTGVVGLRPTQGAVNGAGVFPRSPSFDTVGLMAKTVAEVALLWDAIAPVRQASSTSANLSSLQGLRLGVIRDFTFRDVDPAVAQAVHHAIQQAKQLGAEVIPIDSLFLSQLFDARLYSTIGLYEFYQVLGDAWERSPDGFGLKVQQDLQFGRQVSIADYTKAQTLRDHQIQYFREIFKTIDLILTPTTPRTAPLLSEPVMQRDRKFVQPFSWLGLPALSVPCGMSQGLPIGLQWVGDHYSEALLLQAAGISESCPPRI